VHRGEVDGRAVRHGRKPPVSHQVQLHGPAAARRGTARSARRAWALRTLGGAAARGALRRAGAERGGAGRSGAERGGAGRSGGGGPGGAGEAVEGTEVQPLDVAAHLLQLA